MSGSVNKAMIIGNLGKDPDIRTISAGAKVANFNVATTEKFKNKEGAWVEKTEWHRIVMWRGLADIAEKFLRKGSKVFIEGKLATRSWDDPNGQKKYTTEIVADNVQMLGAQSGGQSAEPSFASTAQGGDDPFGDAPKTPEDDFGDVPF